MSTQLESIAIAAGAGVVEEDLATAPAEPVSSAFGSFKVALDGATPPGIATT